MRFAVHNILLIAALLALAACGGSGGSGSSVAGGGIGGTGTGSITDFGSVIINGTRVFEIDAETEILLDGTAVSEADLQAEGLGMFVRVLVGTDVNSDFTSGTVVSIKAEHLVKGPVTALSPLKVLGQTVVVTAETELPDGLVPATDLGLGDIVQVSGYASADNTIQATRLELKPDVIAEWKLVGPVSGLTASAFMIGDQQVNFGGITPRDCGAGLGNGDLVKVKADAGFAGFAGGDPLTTVTDVECISGELEIPEGAEGELEAEVEGLVTAVALPEFAVSGQQVVIDPTTVFRGGREEDIVLGAKVEAQGKLDTATGVLTAEKITFRDNRIRMRAPLTANNGTTLTVLGLPIITTPLTEDDDAVLPSMVFGFQVEVRGFEDGLGQLIATEIKHKGTQDLNDVRLRGRVDSAPAPALPELTILGITVITTGMTFTGGDGADLTPTEFFALIAAGSEVDLRGGVYAVVPNTISNIGGTEIRIED